jgi:hypothetical protein
MSYIIYKICCDDLPEYIYVGSTKSFIKRKSQHKRACINGDTTKLYTTIRENGGWDNWRMVIIEECGEVTLTQARIKEEENRLKLNANMNMLRCHRTEEERKEDIKEYKKEYNKQYNETNKEKIKEYKTQKFTCECGRTIILGDKSKHLKRNIHKELMEEINK